MGNQKTQWSKNKAVQSAPFPGTQTAEHKNDTPLHKEVRGILKELPKWHGVSGYCACDACVHTLTKRIEDHELPMEEIAKNYLKNIRERHDAGGEDCHCIGCVRRFAEAFSSLKQLPQ